MQILNKWPIPKNSTLFENRLTWLVMLLNSTQFDF